MTKDILLSITGMTPQVVTETLYAIYKSEPEHFPEEIYIITTQKGAEKIRTNLLGDEGQLNKLYREYSLKPIVFNEEKHLKIINDGKGNYIDDARSREDQIVIADYIYHEVKKLTEQTSPKLRIHASIAGGRKTMTYLLGSSMNILCNPEDKLSHVLVSANFENIADFYFPTRNSYLIKDRAGNEFDARDADVELSEIPLIRLKSLIKNHKDSHFSDSYTRAVQDINDALAINQNNLKLTINSRERTIIINEKYTVKLNPKEFAIYKMVADSKIKNISCRKPVDTFNENNLKSAVSLFFRLFKYIPFEKPEFLKIHQDNIKSYTKDHDLIMEHFHELFAGDFSLKTNPKINIEWLYKMIESTNYLLQDSEFIHIVGAAEIDSRCFNICYPYYENENNNMAVPNQAFVTSQKEFLNNAIKSIKKSIQKAVQISELTDYYAINSINNAMNINIPSSNIKFID